MVIDEYAHLRLARLCELVKHLKRHELDTQERLAAREQKVHQSKGERSDPIRKRLFFLLLKQRKHRRAAEEALAARENAVVLTEDAPVCGDHGMRQSRIRDVLARLPEACAGVLAKFAQSQRFALPR